jgi:hypothetical protein
MSLENALLGIRDTIAGIGQMTVPTGKRFELVENGHAVFDKTTGLVWERRPELSVHSWDDCFEFCRNKEINGKRGWQMPTIKELLTLIDYSQFKPALPAGHPFENVRAGFYWSATELMRAPQFAWNVLISGGAINAFFKEDEFFVWALRRPAST